VLVASAWPHTRLDHWRLLARARALENLVYLVACNAAGTDAGVRLAGHSVVVDPWGKILAEADEDESVLVSELDPGRVKEVRAEFPVLDDRLERAGVQTA
jgi:predicted amidohydrolase